MVKVDNKTSYFKELHKKDLGKAIKQITVSICGKYFFVNSFKRNFKEIDKQIKIFRFEVTDDFNLKETGVIPNPFIIKKMQM